MLLSLPDGRTVQGDYNPVTRRVFAEAWPDVHVGQVITADGHRQRVACVTYLTPKLVAVQLHPWAPGPDFCRTCAGFWKSVSCRLLPNQDALSA